MPIVETFYKGGRMLGEGIQEMDQDEAWLRLPGTMRREFSKGEVRVLVSGNRELGVVSVVYFDDPVEKNGVKQVCDIFAVGEELMPRVIYWAKKGDDGLCVAIKAVEWWDREDVAKAARDGSKE